MTLPQPLPLQEEMSRTYEIGDFCCRASDQI